MGAKGHILGGGGYSAGGVQRFVLAVIDLDAERPAADPIAVDFLPHGICVDPGDPFRAAVFEKKGPGACVVDLRTRTVARPVTTTSDRVFYGHGAWSPDASLLYATESRVHRGFEGALVVRDAKTFAELGALPTHGAAPHDCWLVDGGRTMVVANGGGSIRDPRARPSITWVDVASGKLMERVHLASERFNAGHIALTSAGDLVLVSAPREGLQTPGQQLGAVSLRARSGALTTVTEPKNVVKRMLGETLSVAVNEDTRVALTTHPLGDCVSIWQLDDAACLGTIELAGPRGVAMTLYREWFVVSHIESRSVRLSTYSALTCAPTGFFVDPSYISGSHLCVADLRSPAG